MAFPRHAKDSGSSRFWLALSLSTVTAAAVAIPLGLKAVNVEGQISNAPVAPAVVEDVVQSPSTSMTPLPRIRPFEPSAQRGVIAVETSATAPTSASTLAPSSIPQPTIPSVTTTEAPTSSLSTSSSTTELEPSSSDVDESTSTTSAQPAAEASD